MTSYCLSRWCIGAQLKIHVLHTTEVGGLSSTEKSFHVVRACAQCVCIVSPGPKTKGRSILFLLLAFPADAGRTLRSQPDPNKRPKLSRPS